LNEEDHKIFRVVDSRNVHSAPGGAGEPLRWYPL